VTNSRKVLKRETAVLFLLLSISPEIKDSWKEDYCTTLDGFVGNEALVRPKTKEEEEALVKGFLNGLEKLFSDETNRNYLQPFLLCRLQISWQCTA